MHSTSSIDYGIVIEGELDSGEKTILKPGYGHSPADMDFTSAHLAFLLF